MTTNIKDYSTTQASNTSLNGIDVDEGMLPSNLNNAIRALMKNTRDFANDSQWFEYGVGSGAYTAAYASATSFTINGADVTSVYHAGRRIKLTAATPGTIFGTISSSSFSTNTTVNVTWDSGSLSSEAISNVYIAALSKTNSSIPTSIIGTSNIVDGSITNAKLGADSVDGSKIADDSINSEHYVDGSIDTAHIANLQVTNAKLGADSVNGSKIADNSIDSEHYVDGSIDTAHLGNAQVSTVKIADNNITTAKILNANVTADKLATDSVVEAKIQNNAVTTNKINNDAVTIDKIADAVIVTNSEHSGHTPDDNTFFTTLAANNRFLNKDTSELISSGQSWTSNDNFIATTAAIDTRVVDLVDDVGGFVPIANETSFPNTNPDVNNGAGTVVSISSIGSTRTPSGGTVNISGGTVGGSTVTITGCGTTILTAGFGVLVETTTTLNTYTFHRLVPKATEVTAVAAKATEIGRLGTTDAISDMNTLGTSQTVSDMNTLAAISGLNSLASNSSNVTTVANNLGSVNNFAEVYRISANAPTTSLNSGDLWFDSTNNILKVYGASGFQSAGSSVNGTSERFKYTVSGTPTTISGNDDNGNSLNYDAGFIDVYLNGIKMVNTTDVTVTSGSSIVFASALTNGDIVEAVAFGTFSVASLNASNLTSGTVPDARFPATLPSASGVNLTNLNASNIASGTIADARITGAYTGITNLTMTGNLTVDTNTLFVDSSNNRVGIGTSAPDSPLDILTSGNSGLEVNAGTSSAHRIYLGNTGGTSVVGTLSNHAFATITNGSERARIDTNGNLMVGKTSVDTSTSGVELKSDGLIVATRASNPPLLINRRTDDGNVVLIRKDNSNVGFIGVKSSNVFMASNTSNNTGFKINPNAITPSTYNGLDRDNAIDLGSSSSRYKDIYLGGGIYVGGTGTANKLEDYEEGTFTPSFTNGGGFDSLSYVAQRGVYTKIGRIVNFRLQIELGSGVSKNSNRIEISGLPFTSSSALPGGGANWSYVNSKVVNSTSTNIPTLWIASSSNAVNWYKTDGSNFTGNDISGSTTNMDIYINGTYQTDA